MGWIVLLVLVLLAAMLVVYFIGLYNALVTLKNGVGLAWSNIDVLLKQRHDELMKLIEVAKQHMQFEQKTLEAVIAARNAAHSARSSGDVAAVGRSEAALKTSLGSFVATAEAYPELKASHSLQQVLSRISALESSIADRRELYNQSVNLNNTRIAQFPDVIIANNFGFKEAILLQFSAAETADVDVGSLFKA
jgi:LemA protein